MAATKAIELEIAGRTVRVSNPDKPYFADRGLTKLDIVNYFIAVGRALAGRLVRRREAVDPDGQPG